MDRILLKGRLKIVYMSTTCSCRMLVGLFDVARIIGLWCLRAGGIVGSVGRGSMEDDEWRGISGRRFVGDGLLAHVAPGMFTFGRVLGLHRVKLLQ
jgi:hypothetical protein